jgi:hypothetical protein
MSEHIAVYDTDGPSDGPILNLSRECGKRGKRVTHIFSPTFGLFKVITSVITLQNYCPIVVIKSMSCEKKNIEN